MRVAVSGASGRLGSALMTALGDAPFTGPAGPVGWSRPAFDLDADAASLVALLDRDRPEVMIHTAAWTDVDGCALDPALAEARNGTATGRLAEACARRGIDLILVSTNEVFDGRRTDGAGYRVEDEPQPANPYGASKLSGERQATAAYQAATSASAAGASGRLAIVRTAWLFGPGAPDFPHKLLAAAATAMAGDTALRVVADEVGTPTSSRDLAEAIVELIALDALVPPGARHAIHHVVGGGVASRADWAREVLDLVGIDLPIEPVPGATWPRPSTPPSWAVLSPTDLPGGEPMRPWQAALADEAPAFRRAWRCR